MLEIYIGLILTIFKTVWLVLQTLTIVCIIGAVLAAIGFGGMLFNRYHIPRTTVEATEGYFEESGVRETVPSDEFWRELDARHDDTIFANTEEL